MLRLRQIAFAATDLTAAEAALTSALGVPLCYRDPGVGVFGLHNALFAVGDQFLEIVSPTAPNTTAGRLLDKRGGDCGYMALFQTSDLAAAQSRVTQAGVRIVFEAQGEAIRGIHLHPRDVPGAIVSIDAADDPTDWPWAGPRWREHLDTSRMVAIAGMDVAVVDAAAACATWANVLGVAHAGSSFRTDDGTVRFVAPTEHGGREGIVAITLATRDHALVGARKQLLGVTLNFVAA